MKYYEGCEEIAKEKTQDFQAKMRMGYEFKKAYAARRAWEFYNHPEVAGRCYVAVGGLDSITLFLFLRSIGIDVPATSVSMLEDRSIQRVHKSRAGNGWTRSRSFARKTKSRFSTRTTCGPTSRTSHPPPSPGATRRARQPSGPPISWAALKGRCEP